MWNNEQEQYLKTLGEQAMSYTWMQEQTAMFYTKIDRYLGLIIIILSGAVGTNNFLVTELTPREIIFGIISYLVTILGMFLQFLKPMEVTQQRLNIGNKYQDIYYDIKQELAKSKENRVNADDYIKLITQRYIELSDYAPSISSFIIKRFKKIFKDSNITMPLNTNMIAEINIYNETKDETIIEMISVDSKNNENNQDKKIKHNSKNIDFQTYIMERLNTRD